jgi:hypothetical protein
MMQFNAAIRDWRVGVLLLIANPLPTHRVDTAYEAGGFSPSAAEHQPDRAVALAVGQVARAGKERSPAALADPR